MYRIGFLTSFNTTESSSDIDFSISLICGPTTRDSGCLSAGISARRLLGEMDNEVASQFFFKGHTLDWFGHRLRSWLLWYRLYRLCHPTSVSVYGPLADES